MPPRKYILINSLNANFTKWSNTRKQFVGKLPTFCLSVFDHFVGFALKGLKLSFLFRTLVCSFMTSAIHEKIK